MAAELNLPAAPPGWLAADTVERSRAALDSGLARETWKYSPLPKTLRTLLGAPSSSHPPVSDVPGGITVTAFSRLAAPPPLALQVDRYPLAGITASLAAEGWLVDVRRSPEQPVVLNASPGIDAPVLIRVAPGCSVDILESGAGGGIQAAVRVLAAARDSTVRWAQAELAADAEQWMLLQARLEGNASLELHQHATGARFRRLDTHVTLAGDGSDCRSTGAGVVGGGAHLDRQLVVEHIGRNTRSRTRLHNLAAGKGRCSFNGRIHIHPGATGADADLSNKNLALDADAEINTKPELEIYTDDVRCSHGATVGQLDDNALFFLRSRGLPEPLARRLLSIGFLAECVGGPLAERVSADFETRLDSMPMAVAATRRQDGATA